MGVTGAKQDTSYQIACYLIMKAADIRDVSLYHGKMGIVCSLYAYAVNSGSEYIKDYAWDLLQDVYPGVYETLPIGVECGLVGLGYGVTRICQMMHTDSDLNEILQDIDDKIMSYDPRRMTDMSFRKGALGVWNYIAIRKNYGTLSSIDSIYQKELNEIIIKNVGNNEPIDVMDDIKMPSWKVSEYQGKAMGIDGGLAYYLIKS